MEDQFSQVEEVIIVSDKVSVEDDSQHITKKSFLQKLREKIKGVNVPHLHPFIYGVLGALMVMCVSVAFLFVYRGHIFKLLADKYYNQETSSAIGDQQSTDGPRPFTQESYVVDTVKASNPAVVSIVISKNVPKYDTVYGNTNPFEDMFPGFMFQTPQLKQNGTEKKDIGGGSGFLVSSNGLIVTNKHVVADKEAEYTVYLNDGKKYTAKVLARDPVLDIAVIKIDPSLGKELPFLEFGDSDKLQVGQSVVAIGNALGEFRNTVSVGVVSGLSRSLTAGDQTTGKSESLDHVIQTDAAINPGNSGGPLLSLSGKVIGVNVAVAQGSQSIGFALPANSIKSVVQSVKETGKIVRPYLGIRYTEITSEIKDKNNLSVDYGVLVQRGTGKGDLAVIPGSPADKAGIVENDIVLEVDGVKLEGDNSNLSGIIRQKNVGGMITLHVLSKGKEKDVQVTLEAAPENLN